MWPVSFVTRRLGKVITCLGGEGGGKMGLGGKGLSSRSGIAAKGALRIKVGVRDIGIELIACYVRGNKP